MHDAAIDAELVAAPHRELHDDELHLIQVQTIQDHMNDPHKHDERTLEELDELEDEIDDTLLQQLRIKRLNEMKIAAKTAQTSNQVKTNIHVAHFRSTITYFFFFLCVWNLLFCFGIPRTSNSFILTICCCFFFKCVCCGFGAAVNII